MGDTSPSVDGTSALAKVGDTFGAEMVGDTSGAEMVGDTSGLAHVERTQVGDSRTERAGG